MRNGRFRKDPEGRGRTQEQVAKEFAAITMTQPDKAAEIIHRGVEAGKARILVGPDAHMFDALHGSRHALLRGARSAAGSPPEARRLLRR